MIYVALLRGINVGGNNKIDMKMLKQVFADAGMNNVSTYINTGNIIFSCDQTTKSDLSSILEEAIHSHFGLQIKVLLRDYLEMSQVIASLPDDWANDERMKSDVIFLWEDISPEALIDQLGVKPDIDTVICVPGAVMWSVDRPHVTKSGLNHIVRKKNIYQKTTVRNVNTTRKIFEWMTAAHQQELE